MKYTSQNYDVDKHVVIASVSETIGVTIGYFELTMA